MTHRDFVIWLRGFLDGVDTPFLGVDRTAAIKAALEQVHDAPVVNPYVAPRPDPVDLSRRLGGHPFIAAGAHNHNLAASA